MPREAWNKLKPRKFVLTDRCSRTCSLNPVNWPGEQGALVHSWYEAGDNDPTISGKCDALGHHVSQGAVGRHRANHLAPLEEGGASPIDGKLDKVNHLEFLEQLVARAASNVSFATKVSPEMGIRAVEMIYKLTQGSQMDNLMKAVTAAMSGEPEDDADYVDPMELAAAKASDDEQQQADVAP